jgi:hypothetical protein
MVCFCFVFLTSMRGAAADSSLHDLIDAWNGVRLSLLFFCSGSLISPSRQMLLGPAGRIQRSVETLALTEAFLRTTRF